MVKSASTNSLSSYSSSNAASTAGNWRGPSSASELLRPGLLYHGPFSRKHLEVSQASANLELFQREFYPTASVLAREMSAPFFEDNPNANITGAVAFVGCKTGQVPHRSLPISALMQLVALERFSRKHSDVAPFALVGLESANRGLSKLAGSHSELLCRYAFKVSRLIENRPTLFSRVTPLLDCDVLYSDDALPFSRKRKELDIGDSDRIATAIKALSLSTSGIQLKVGATNYGSRRELDSAKRFATRDQMQLFLGQTIAEDEQLKREMGFLYTSGPASRRLGQLVLSTDELHNAAWLKVDHLAIGEADFKAAWQEHEQLAQLHNVISELDPALSMVNESLAWALDCSQRMLDFHDAQLFEISTNQASVSARTLENLKRDYSRAMRTYLRDLAARNFDWLLEVSKQIGFQVDASNQSATRSDAVPANSSMYIGGSAQGNVKTDESVRSKAA